MNDQNKDIIRIITVVVYNRPQYFKRCLLSIIKNNLKGWKIFFNIEPSEHIEVIKYLIKDIIPNEVDFKIKINPNKTDLQNHCYLALDSAFNANGKSIIYLEEDVVISSDVTRLADWYYMQNRKGIMCLNLLYGECGGINHISKEDFPDYIIKTKQFNSYGIVLTDKQWLKYFNPYWFDYSHGFTDDDGNLLLGWDWAIFKHNLKDDKKLFVLQPLLARANHIGRRGAFCTPGFYDKTFKDIKISNIKNKLMYTLINEKNMEKLL